MKRKKVISPLINTDERIKKIGEERRKHSSRIKVDDTDQKSQKPRANSQ